MTSQDDAAPREKSGPYPRPRRPPTAQEAKALAHPLRLRILRLCGQRELTNKELADRLDGDPATVLYHVRLLVEAGLLEPAAVRTGKKGALEKPYRSTGLSWWLDDPLGKARELARTGEAADHPDQPDQTGQPDQPDPRTVLWETFNEELREAGPESIATGARFFLHLSPEEVTVLESRLLAVLDEYVESDHERLDRPAHSGFLMLHRLPE